MMLDELERQFPAFVQALRCGDYELEDVLPPATEAELREIEASVGLALPASYRRLLGVTRGFWLLGGAIQFGQQHPFVHDFPPLSALTEPQLEMVRAKGGEWPPPSQGMICFAEYGRDADGDQVLFDASANAEVGEWPVVYYSHESRPAVERVGESFVSWVENVCLQQMAE